MDTIIDEAAVWRRVTAGTEPDAPETGPILPELLDLLTETRRSAADCRALAERSGGSVRRTLWAVYAQKRNQIRTITGLCRFLTGERPAADRRKADPVPVLADGLRGLMQREELAAGRTEALAARSAGEVRMALLTLCEEDREIFHRLLTILGGI